MIDKNSVEIMNIVTQKLAEKNPELTNTFREELINILMTRDNDLAEFFGNIYDNLEEVRKELNLHKSKVHRALVNFQRRAYTISIIQRIYNELTTIYGPWLVKHNFEIEKDYNKIKIKLGDDQRIKIKTTVTKKNASISIHYNTKTKSYGFIRFPINCYQYATRRAIKICKIMICKAKDKNLCS